MTEIGWSRTGSALRRRESHDSNSTQIVSIRRHADIAAHVDALDWPKITAELDSQGCAVLTGLLTPDQCRAVAALYPA